MFRMRRRKASKLQIIWDYLKRCTQCYMLGRKWVLQSSYLAANKLVRTIPLDMKDRNQDYLVGKSSKGKST